MSKEKTEDRGQITIRYRFDQQGYVRFIDPCCDEIPVDLFVMVTQAFSEVQKKWNSKIKED